MEETMKKLWKKISAGMLAMTMGLGLCACGSEGTATTAGSTAGTSDTGADTTANTASENTETGSEKTGDTEENTSGNAGGSGEFADMTAKELAVRLGNGFNLGNTFEAADMNRPGDYVSNSVTHFETLWGQPVTTKEMIDDIKNAGMDTLRIPVAWTNAMDIEKGDYTIKEEYLARVKEVVDWAIEDGMFVVLNDHWDGQWWGVFGEKDASRREIGYTIFTEMWTQVGNYFKDYDDHLILEGGNEELGDRFNDIGNPIVQDGNGLTKDECYETANKVNQLFVDTIRSQGGNNATRFLLIPGYGTDITQTLDPRWHMPQDSAKDKLFLSVHYYTPWSYCGSSGSSTWGTKKNYEEMNTLMKNLSVFTEQGYAIIIGECGVLPTSNREMKPNWQLWYENFYANCDIYGYVPLLWDTGNMLDKNTHQWIDSGVKDFLLENSYEKQKSMSYEEVKAAAEKKMADALAAAPETFDTNQKLAGDGTAIAWIMWDSQDWNIVYSVGDTYDPDSKTAGVKATDVEVTGEGTYTIALDFTGTDAGKSIGTAFSAIGIANGEELFPGYVIDIKKILINGNEYTMKGRNYTSSDDGLCTRSNLYNEWVPSVPDDARTRGGGTMGCTPTVLEKECGDVETIEITFEYLPGAAGVSTNDANSKN